MTREAARSDADRLRATSADDGCAGRGGGYVVDRCRCPLSPGILEDAAMVVVSVVSVVSVAVVVWGGDSGTTGRLGLVGGAALDALPGALEL